MVMEITLSSEEIEILKIALSKLVVKNRTGEIGILHGLDRFTSTHICLKKKERENLDALMKKVGIPKGLKIIEVNKFVVTPYKR